MSGWVYLAAALPLLASALRCFARAGRSRALRPALRWFALGVLLGAFGLDSLRTIYALTAASPAPLAWLPLALIGGALLYVFARVWGDLARPLPAERAAALVAERGRELEALAEEAALLTSERADAVEAPAAAEAAVEATVEGESGR